MPKYTVFAIYEDGYQPYAVTLNADTPQGAIILAQLQCMEDNGAELVDDGQMPFGSCTLVGFQVVAGAVEAIDIDQYVPDKEET